MGISGSWIPLLSRRRSVQSRGKLGLTRADPRITGDDDSHHVRPFITDPALIISLLLSNFTYPFDLYCDLSS
jgi:hypothetical protein